MVGPYQPQHRALRKSRGSGRLVSHRAPTKPPSSRYCRIAELSRGDLWSGAGHSNGPRPRGTFLAILWALYGVHYDELNAVKPVTGMEGLINGLSGKFLSSIIALLLSIVFTMQEKHIVRSLRRSYDALISAISNAIPFLSTSRILLDIHRFSAKQTVSVSNISSEVVDRLTNAFNDRVVPGIALGMSTGVAEKLQNEFRPTMERIGRLTYISSRQQLCSWNLKNETL